MKLLDTLQVYFGSEERRIELYHGDLLEMPDAVDILVVSAFPNNYVPIPTTLIGALSEKGISIARLSKSKAADLRDTFSCWLSEEITDPAFRFKRILCFEPRVRGKPAEVVGDIFQSLTPFVTGDFVVESVAMPLVATGGQRASLVDVLEPLVDAAVHWLSLGLPLHTLKIVERSETKAAELKGAFAILKKRYANPSPVTQPSTFKHDLFISYSHENTAEVLFLVEELSNQRPDIKIFVDRKALDVGAAWQAELFDALDDCRKVLAIYSPTYLTSKVCKEEFNIALFRHRNSDEGTLIPIYLYSASLPTYMQLIQFMDCREGDKAKMRKACQEILARFDA